MSYLGTSQGQGWAGEEEPQLWGRQDPGVGAPHCSGTRRPLCLAVLLSTEAPSALRNDVSHAEMALSSPTGLQRERAASILGS